MKKYIEGNKREETYVRSDIKVGDAIFSCSVVPMFFSYADIRLCLKLDFAY